MAKAKQKNKSTRSGRSGKAPARKTAKKTAARTAKSAKSKGKTGAKGRAKNAGGKKKSAAKKTAVKKTPAKKTPAKKAAGRATKATSAGRKGAPKLRPVGEPTAGGSVPPSSGSSTRNFGLRGAAPWVARHAAKHAEELRKRNAEPPPPGSARATLRVPPEAEEIKSKIGELHQAVGKVRSLRKRFEKSFYEIGEILTEVQEKQLHEAKGYSSFESFLDREVDLPRNTSLRLIRIVHTFQRDMAYDFGLDRLTTALAALDGELVAAPPSHPSSRGFSSTALPPRPPLRFDD